MVTNMSTDQILSLYNVFKDIAAKSSGMDDMTDVLGIQRLKLNGYDARIYDYGGTNLSLYNFVLYDDSVKAVSNAMKENLGEKKTKVIKSFSFDINTPYEKKVIGADVTGTRSLVQLPNFVGQTVDYVRSYCSRNGISLNVKGGNGYVISQSVPSGANIEDVNSITVTAGGSTNTTTITDEEDEDVLEDNGIVPTPDEGSDTEDTETGGSDGSSDGGSSDDTGDTETPSQTE